MPPRSFLKHGLPMVVLAVLLLAACSKKSDTATLPATDPGANPGGDSAAPAPAAPPQAPGTSAGAKEYVEFGAEKGAQGDLDGAVDAFNTAISLNPKYPPAFYWRGFARLKQNKLTDAMQDFNQAIELDPNYQAAYERRGNLKGLQGDFDGAIEDFKHLLTIDSKSAVASYNLGHAYYFQGDEDAALAEIEQSLALDPKNPFCYFIRGLIRYDHGHRDDAVADFQKSVGLNFPDAAFWLYICEAQDGQSGLGSKNLSDALSETQIFKPGDFSSDIANFILGRKSEKDFLAKAAASPENDRLENTCEAWFYAGMVRLLNGDKEGAKDYFTKAMATNSKGSEEYVEARHELSTLDSP